MYCCLKIHTKVRFDSFYCNEIQGKEEISRKEKKRKTRGLGVKLRSIE